MNEPLTIATIMMGADEARHYVRNIKTGLESAERAILHIRKMIYELHRFEGWRSLGYASFRECVETEFQKGKSTLYHQLAAAALEETLSTNGGIGSIAERVLRPLAKKKFSEEAQRTLWQIAVNVAGAEASVTSTLMNSVVETLGEAIVTGTLADENGEQSSIWERVKVDALARTIETRNRQQEHISGNRKIVSAAPASISIDPDNAISLHLLDHLTPDQIQSLTETDHKLRVTIWLDR